MPVERPPFTPRLLRRPRELLSWIAGRPSRRRVKISTSLRFMHEVLGLERLHYGLWEDEPLSLEGLKSAQRRYSQVLQSWIPEGVESILDVGAGVGADAQEMSREGYRVEGLSPDPYQEREFTRRTGLPFHLVRFQEFESERAYDLILMSESAQYIWLESLFQKVCELAPGGHLLIADYFLAAEPEPGNRKTAHPEGSFRRRAEAAGLHLEREEDVTERAAPTLDLAGHWVRSYVEPSLAIGAETLASRRPLLFRIARALLGKRLRRALEKQRRQIDGAEFRRSMRYKLMLWRVPPL